MTTLGTPRASLPRAFAVTPAPAFVELAAEILAFAYFSGEMHCWKATSAGAFVEDVSSVTLGVTVPVLRQTLVSHDFGAGSSPWLMWNESTSAGSATKNIFSWDIARDALYTIAVPNPGAVTNWSVGRAFVPPGETDGNIYFFTHATNGLNFDVSLYGCKADGSTAPVVVAGPVTEAGIAQSLPMYAAAAAYINRTAGGHWSFPFAGGAASSSATGTITGASSTYLAEAADDWSYHITTNSRRQRRNYRDASGDGHGSFGSGVMNGEVAFSLNAPNTSNANTHVSVNRARDTSSYFPWNLSPSNELKFGQPSGLTADDGHSTTAPSITVAAHATYGTPTIVHVLDYQHPW